MDARFRAMVKAAEQLAELGCLVRLEAGTLAVTLVEPVCEGCARPYPDWPADPEAFLRERGWLPADRPFWVEQRVQVELHYTDSGERVEPHVRTRQEHLVDALALELSKDRPPPRTVNYTELMFTPDEVAREEQRLLAGSCDRGQIAQWINEMRQHRSSSSLSSCSSCGAPPPPLPAGAEVSPPAPGQASPYPLQGGWLAPDPGPRPATQEETSAIEALHAARPQAFSPYGLPDPPPPPGRYR